MGKFIIVCVIDILVGWLIFGSVFMQLIFLPPLTAMYCMIIFLWILYNSPLGVGIRSILVTIGIGYVVGTVIYLFSENFRELFNRASGISYSMINLEFKPSGGQVILYSILTWIIFGTLGLWKSESEEANSESSSGDGDDKKHMENIDDTKDSAEK